MEPYFRLVKTFPGWSNALTGSPQPTKGQGVSGVHLPPPLTDGADLQGRETGSPGGARIPRYPKGEAVWQLQAREAQACCVCGYPQHEGRCPATHQSLRPHAQQARPLGEHVPTSPPPMVLHQGALWLTCVDTCDLHKITTLSPPPTDGQLGSSVLSWVPGQLV